MIEEVSLESNEEEGDEVTAELMPGVMPMLVDANQGY
jgi:hypothetical protein